MNRNAENLLFVYGTLRRGSPHPMRRALDEGAAFIGEGTVPGRLYEIDGYPGLLPPRTAEERVRGDLFRILDPSLLDRLDDYEECSPRFPPPHEYRRVRRIVRLDDGREYSAWVYEYLFPVREERFIPSGDYFARRRSAEGSTSTEGRNRSDVM